MEGAIEAVKKLAESGKYEMFIATTPLGETPWPEWIRDFGLRTTLGIYSTRKCLSLTEKTF
jgi:hypothetical protein